jgi:DNA invertase Pin-like site-specific DNA recombinase
MPTAILYTRVSTDEQADSGLGLAAQRDRLEADRRSWTVLEFLEDAGYGAATMNRPAIRQALELLAAGDADVLALAALDRVSRSVVDFGKLLDLAQRQGWTIVALDLVVDTATAAGELVANVVMAVAQWERRRIAERTRAAMATAQARGRHLGRSSTVPTEVRTLIRDKRAADRSLNAIAVGQHADNIPTGQGGAAWDHSSVRPCSTRSNATRRPELRTAGTAARRWRVDLLQASADLR